MTSDKVPLSSPNQAASGDGSRAAVLAWMENHGVLLEMKVTSDFRRHLPLFFGNVVSHGRIYLDEDSGEKF